MTSRLFTRVRLGHVARTHISSGEPAKLTICQHQTADTGDRGQICPECGLPMIYVPGAAR
jgi:hypothetical protein